MAERLQGKLSGQGLQIAFVLQDADGGNRIVTRYAPKSPVEVPANGTTVYGVHGRRIVVGGREVAERYASQAEMQAVYTALVHDPAIIRKFKHGASA